MPNEAIKTSVKVTVTDAPKKKLINVEPGVEITGKFVIGPKCDNCVNGRLSDNSPCPKCNHSEDQS